MKSTINYHRPTVLSIVTGLVVVRKESVLSKEFEDVIMTCSKFRGNVGWGKSAEPRRTRTVWYWYHTYLLYLSTHLVISNKLVIVPGPWTMVIFLSTMKSFIYFSAVAIIIGGALAQQQQQYRGLQQQEDGPPVDADSPWPTYSPTSAAGADATGGPTSSSAEATSTGGGAATTTTDDASGGWGGSCPEELAGSMTLAVPFAQSPDGEVGSTLTFKYAIVVASSSSDGRDVLCARLERASDVVGGGYIGFGISPGGTMDGAVGIIGLPDGGTVMKYDLSGDRSVEVMTDDRQTLMSASITTRTEDGMTIMEFAKYLIEDGENEILANGTNTFLYALGGEDGGDDLSYHADRGSFVLDFETPAIIETEGTAFICLVHVFMVILLGTYSLFTSCHDYGGTPSLSF